jgi:hypothetical protein
MDAADIAAALTALPMHAFDDLADDAGSPPPTAAGFYAWWQTPDALPGVIATPHPSTDLELLYVGIAPGKATSARKLVDRLGNHHSGAIGSSTLKFSVTAFLWEREGWQPTMASRPQLTSDESAALQAWQRAHLSVQWVAALSPWVLEPAVVALLRPPLNRDHNSDHPEYRRVGAARKALRVEAARRPVPFKKRR